MAYQNNVVEAKENNADVTIEMKPSYTAVTVKEKPEKRRPVLRQALYPILCLMKAFGLTFNDSDSFIERIGRENKWKETIFKYYAFFMNAVIFAVLLKTIAAFWYVTDGENGYFMIAIYLIFAAKTCCQTFYVLYLSHKAILWNFIVELEKFLDEITLSKCCIVEDKFVKQIRRWLIFFVVFMVFCTASNAALKFIPNEELAVLLKYIMLPLKSQETGMFLVKLLLDFVLLAGWFLPAALCGTLMQTLQYTVHEYYRYLQHQGSKGICVKQHIREIRLKFLKLSSLASSLDGMVNFLLMISFLGDMMLVCLVLRVGMYTFHGFYSRVFIFSWMLPPIFSLLYLSKQASRLHDKGQEMFSIVQFFNTDQANIAIKMEFDMLLFHLNTEPVVMTIWKMIPLYRSIIISIFVSIVTYFALIISLA